MKSSDDKLQVTRLARKCKQIGIEPSKSLLASLIRFSTNIINTMAFPTGSTNATSQRTVAALRNSSIPLETFFRIDDKTRVMLAQEAVYYALMSFFRTKEPINVWKYVSKYAPRIFAGIITEEIPDRCVELWGRITTPYREEIMLTEDVKDVMLPGSPKEYLQLIETVGVNKVSTLYPSLKREHFFYILRKLKATLHHT